MPSATHTVTISAAPDAVFAFLADGENAPSWRPGVLDIKHVSGSGVGAAYAQGVKGPGGRRIAADYEVTAYDPPRRLAFKATAGPVRPEGEYLLEPADGGTKLTFSLHVDLSGLKGLILGRSVQSTMDSEVHSIERIQAAMSGAA